MERRTVIGSAGIALSTALAGCLNVANGAVMGQDDSTNNPSEPESSDPKQSEMEFNPEYMQTEIEVGSPEGIEERPHSLQFWNATPSSLLTNFHIFDKSVEKISLDVTTDLPADVGLSVSLVEPSDYRLQIQAPSEEIEATVTVSRSWFDCNPSSTQIGLFEDGRVESRKYTTWLECTDESVTGGPDNVTTITDK